MNGLTPRQQVILDLTSEGLQAKQIAVYMGKSVETIKWHLTQARKTLGANTTTHAVAIYLRAKKVGSRGDAALAVTGIARASALADAPDEPLPSNESSPHGNPKDSGSAVTPDWPREPLHNPLGMEEPC